MNLPQYVRRRRKMIDQALDRYAWESYPEGGRAGMLSYATTGESACGASR